MLFSIVFFSKLFIGLAGVKEFLMTGKLHLPIPAVIIAGPLFRGEGFFMLILLLTTLVLIGPSWCSFLCYFGCWDNIASRYKKQPNKKRPILLISRIIIFILIISTTLVLRFLNVDTMTAVIAAFCFAGIGIMLILFVSRKTGIMIHCLAYCPIGFISNTLGRINPFRIRIKDNCTNCLACSRVCKYNALTKEDIERRKPGFTCTLCGDCIETCKTDSIHYTFFRSKGKMVKTIFYVMVISCHAVTLALARI
jgi:polyferredoxin